MRSWVLGVSFGSPHISLMYLDKGVSSMAETLGISDMPPQPLSCWLADIGVVICAAKTKVVGFERETGGWGGFMVVFIRRKTYLISLLKILHVLKTGDIMVKQATYNIFLKLIINLHFFSEKKEEKEKKPHTHTHTQVFISTSNIWAKKGTGAENKMESTISHLENESGKGA